MVLLNVPAGNEITSVGVPSSGTGTATQVGKQISYTPNGFEGNDTFTYTTAEGTATVTVAVTAGTPVVAVPEDDFFRTVRNQAFPLQVLANDPADSRLLEILNQGITERFGTAVTRGNVIEYTPFPDFEGTDEFEYRTQSGIAKVQIRVGQTLSDAPIVATVFLRNTTQFQAQFRILNVPGVFRDCLDTTLAFGFQNVGPAVNMEPFSEEEWCIEVPFSNVPQSVTFVAEEVGVNDPRETNPLACTVSRTQDIAVTFNQEREFDVDGNIVVDRVFLTCTDVP